MLAWFTYARRFTLEVSIQHVQDRQHVVIQATYMAWSDFERKLNYLTLRMRGNTQLNGTYASCTIHLIFRNLRKPFRGGIN